MRPFILTILIIPLLISVGYLLTHSMPSHNITAIKEVHTGERIVTGNSRRTAKIKLPEKAPRAGDPGIPEGNHVRIETDNGTFLIELFQDEAPNTVANFKVLAAREFYNGLTFHRVVPGFMAQGGDPKGNGTGGPGYHIKAEINSHKHVTGAVGMIHSSDPDSAGSQFYICYGDHPNLDGKYTVFGQVIEGQEAVNRIRKGTVMNKVTVLP